MADWWLEDSTGKPHKALFVKAVLADHQHMKWTRGLSWEKEIRNKTRQIL